MPEFIRPQRAIIETGGGSGLGFAAPLAAAAVATGSVVLFIAAHLVLIAICTAALAALGVTAVCVLRRFTLVVHDVPARPELPLSVHATVLAPPRRAIAPVHNHLHFHGLAADDIAAAVSQVVNVPPGAVRASLHALPEASERRSR